jgi:hypothetical protein
MKSKTVLEIIAVYLFVVALVMVFQMASAWSTVCAENGGVCPTLPPDAAPRMAWFIFMEIATHGGATPGTILLLGLIVLWLYLKRKEGKAYSQ